MPAVIPDWPRERLMPGGQAPLLYYRVYGDLDLDRPLSVSQYRCAGTPAGIQLIRIVRDAHAGAYEEPAEEPMATELRRSLPGFDSLLAASTNACAIYGSPDDHSNLNYFRDTIGLIAWMLDGGGKFVYDPLQVRCWAPEEWRSRVFDPARPQPLAHCVILVSEEEEAPGRCWYHTRGRRKFGRPDVSVHRVPDEFRDGVVELCTRLIVHQAEGTVVPDGQPVKMRGLPEGAVVTNQGDLEDLDFNNVHLEIAFPGW